MTDAISKMAAVPPPIMATHCSVAAAGLALEDVGLRPEYELSRLTMRLPEVYCHFQSPPGEATPGGMLESVVNANIPGHGAFAP